MPAMTAMYLCRLIRQRCRHRPPCRRYVVQRQRRQPPRPSLPPGARRARFVYSRLELWSQRRIGQIIFLIGRSTPDERMCSFLHLMRRGSHLLIAVARFDILEWLPFAGQTNVEIGYEGSPTMRSRVEPGDTHRRGISGVRFCLAAASNS